MAQGLRSVLSAHGETSAQSETWVGLALGAWDLGNPCIANRMIFQENLRTVIFYREDIHVSLESNCVFVEIGVDSALYPEVDGSE